MGHVSGGRMHGLHPQGCRHGHIPGPGDWQSAEGFLMLPGSLCGLVAAKGQSWILQTWDIQGSKKTFTTFQEKENSLCLTEGMLAQYMAQRSAVHASWPADIVQEQEGKQVILQRAIRKICVFPRQLEVWSTSFCICKWSAPHSMVPSLPVQNFPRTNDEWSFRWRKESKEEVW